MDFDLIWAGPGRKTQEKELVGNPGCRPTGASDGPGAEGRQRWGRCTWCSPRPAQLSLPPALGSHVPGSGGPGLTARDFSLLTSPAVTVAVLSETHWTHLRADAAARPGCGDHLLRGFWSLGNYVVAVIPCRSHNTPSR